jgi:hypothetical protein
VTRPWLMVMVIMMMTKMFFPIRLFFLALLPSYRLTPLSATLKHLTYLLCLLSVGLSFLGLSKN